MSGPYWNGRRYETAEDRERDYEPCRWRDEKIKKLEAEIRAAFEKYGSGVPFDDFRAALTEKE